MITLSVIILSDIRNSIQARSEKRYVVSVEGVTRVIRGCGWLPNDPGLEGRTCFKRTGTSNVRYATY